MHTKTDLVSHAQDGFAIDSRRAIIAYTHNDQSGYRTIGAGKARHIIPQFLLNLRSHGATIQYARRHARLPTIAATSNRPCSTLCQAFASRSSNSAASWAFFMGRRLMRTIAAAPSAAARSSAVAARMSLRTLTLPI